VHDVIVVGARCAGAPLAMLLARRGARVLLVDRAIFPSDIPHGHFIHRHGPRRLHEWGVLPGIAARTPAIVSAIFDMGDFPLVTRNLVENDVALGYGPRRTTLDRILIDAAVESGAEFRQRFSVLEYVFSDGMVVGVRGRDGDGREVEERAVITVGADGRHSQLARAVQAPVYNEVPPILCFYFSYCSGVESECLEVYARHADRRVIFSFKTEDDLYAVFAGIPMEEFAEVKRDIDAAFMRTVDLIPDFSARLRAGRREERYYGASDLLNVYRKPYGPGWALTGDAGLHKDPYLRSASATRCVIPSSWPRRSVRDSRGSGRCSRRSPISSSAATLYQRATTRRTLPKPASRRRRGTCWQCEPRSRTNPRTLRTFSRRAWA
jgi:flavin-dependent dehydrogenase